MPFPSLTNSEKWCVQCVSAHVLLVIQVPYTCLQDIKSIGLMHAAVHSHRSVAKTINRVNYMRCVRISCIGLSMCVGVCADLCNTPPPSLLPLINHRWGGGSSFRKEPSHCQTIKITQTDGEVWSGERTSTRTAVDRSHAQSPVCPATIACLYKSASVWQAADHAQHKQAKASIVQPSRPLSSD